MQREELVYLKWREKAKEQSPHPPKWGKEKKEKKISYNLKIKVGGSKPPSENHEGLP